MAIDHSSTLPRLPPDGMQGFMCGPPPPGGVISGQPPLRTTGLRLGLSGTWSRRDGSSQGISRQSQTRAIDPRPASKTAPGFLVFGVG